jgi:hypothetical protein
MQRRGCVLLVRSFRVGVVELLDGVGLSVVKVWLALLLGGFEMEQRGGFYDGAGIFVEMKWEEIAIA